MEQEKKDNHVEFGSYPQGKNGEVAKILWRILDNNDGQLLLISEYVLDLQKWNRSNTEIGISGVPRTGKKEDKLAAILPWEKCELRSWLNGYFYNHAFTAAEKNLIIERLNSGNGAYIRKEEKPKNEPECRPIDESYQSYEERGCVDTRDKVFCLNVKEALDFFANNSYTIANTVWRGNTDRMAKATDYAIWKGAYKSGSETKFYLNPYSGETYSSNKADAVKVKRGTEFIGAVSWWLRNIGAKDITADFPRAAHHEGQISMVGWGVINTGGISRYAGNVGVRPAILIHKH